MAPVVDSKEQFREEFKNVTNHNTKMAYKRNITDPAEKSKEVTIELDGKKLVTIKKFNGINIVDIREFYVDKKTGEKKPGKKGISLTEDLWQKLIGNASKVQEALDDLNNDIDLVKKLKSIKSEVSEQDAKNESQQPDGASNESEAD